MRRSRYQKKALLLVTDGNDTASSVTLEAVLRSAQRSEVSLYALGIGHSERGSFGHSTGDFNDTVDMTVLGSLSEVTGGKTFSLEAAHSGGVDRIDQACLEVSAELRQQYTLAYYPTNQAKDGSFRRIELKTRNPYKVVRTRQGFFAPIEKK